MEQVIARCGFECDDCMAYVANSHSYEDRVKVAEAWSKYFGLKIAPEKLLCNGCHGQKCAGHEFPDLACPIRNCVIEHGMNTCADCIDFPCEKMETRMKGVEEVIERFRGKITHEEFDSYMAPYDSRKILNELRDRRIEERTW